MPSPNASLSYLPQSPLHVRTHGGVHFVFEASALTLPLYFALKGKHHYQLENSPAFVSRVRECVAQLVAQHDVVVFPQSRYPFVSDITSETPARIELQKRSKSEICELALEGAKWNREARRSQEAAWAEMGDSFTINAIKSNQRKHYVPHLFKRTEVPAGARVLFVDDFIMSGNTLAAMHAATGIEHGTAFGVFYQLDSADNLKWLETHSGT